MKTWVEISQSALRHNAQVLMRAGTPAKLMAVVKSNAYGHGLVPVAKTLASSAAWFAVDSVEEGSALREAGIRKPILVIGHVLDEQLDACARLKLSVVVYNLGSLKAMAQMKKGRGAFRVHLPIETGTTREGFALRELPDVLTFMKESPSLRLEGTYMHFADVERVKKQAYAIEQLKVYQEAIHIIYQWGMNPGVRHTASSAAVLLRPDARFDLVRPGIVLYGLWPSPAVRAVQRGVHLQSVLSWKTRVAQVKEVSKGVTVGYDRTEKLKRNSKVAVLPVGYWDGLDRRLSSRATVLIRGKRCRVLGRICMNMCMVDVTDVPGVAARDEVVLIGAQGKAEISADAFAKTMGTINYEAVTRINPQIPRVLVH